MKLTVSIFSVDFSTPKLQKKKKESTFLCDTGKFLPGHTVSLTFVIT